ncbi:MAG: histidine phosphatase family protein [Acidimicrobiia bacterium]|nr:histidine phosphatase family protein [Acidimicrobiia bacterium]
MTTFVLVRHAKAERPPGIPDIARELSDRGRLDAALVGRHLGANLPPPAVVVTSPAHRALDTARIVIDAAGWKTVPHIDARLYGGGVADLLAVLAEQATGPVLAFGHQPVWSATVAALTGETIALPTAAAARIDGIAAPARGVLRWVITPADLGGGPA